MEKYKPLLVAKVYWQVEVIEFSEVFSPIEKITSIRFILSIATSFGLEVKKIDVNTIFLHGDLEE